MKLIKWWVEPHKGPTRYANTVTAARQEAKRLLGMPPRQSFGHAGYSFRFEEIVLDRKHQILKELNAACDQHA